MNQYPQQPQQPPPQWDPRFGPPPQTYAPPYYLPGQHSPLTTQRSLPVAIVGLGAFAGMLASLLLATPANFIFSVFVDGSTLRELLSLQLDAPPSLPGLIPFIVYSLLFSALLGIIIAVPRIGIGSRLAYIPVAIVVGTLAGIAIDIFIVDSLTNSFRLDRPLVDWLRPLSYNLPLSLGASLFVGLATR